jgi:HrpA-like helicases
MGDMRCSPRRLAPEKRRLATRLLNEPWLQGRRIIMLEPRRLAARAAAHRMASMRGEAVGETVGYRIRFETNVGAKTRIEVVTEGILTRLLQNDPSLSTYGLVIFDEFHERSLHADVALALTLECNERFGTICASWSCRPLWIVWRLPTY